MRELASLWNNRRVLRSLARHDLRRSYAGSAAGLAWAVLTPLVPLLVFTAVFSLGLRLPLGGAPYVFGFAAAYVPWVLVSTSITRAAGSILEHRVLIKRVPFPVEIIPVYPFIVSSLPHAILIALTASATFAAGYGRVPELLFVVYGYACATVFATGAGLFLAALAVLVRDIPQALPSFVNVWFWVTPIAWAAGQLPERGRALLMFNPASYVVACYRYALMPKVFGAPGIREAAAFWIVTTLMFIAGAATFRRLRPHFWECL